MSRIVIDTRKDHRHLYRRFLDRAEVEAFLCGLAVEMDMMAHFREVWQGTDPGRGGSAPSDRKLIEGLAAQIANSQLWVRYSQVPRRLPQKELEEARHNGRVSRTYEKPEPPEPAPPPRPAPVKTLKTRAPAPPPAAAPPPMDAKRQAAALKAAAQSGAPFCEQCGKEAEVG